MPIQENPTKLLQILHHLPLATAIYDQSDLRIAFANRAMLTIWCQDQSIIGRTFSDTFPSFKKGGFSSILQRVWKNGESYVAADTPAVIVEGCQHSTRYFDFEFRALLNAEKNTYAILHTATDVTARRSDQALIDHQREQISYNSDLETITHTLSHDAKNPLSVAKLGIGHLNPENSGNSALAERWYQVIHDALDDLDTIITKTAQLSVARTYHTERQLFHLQNRIPKWINQAKIALGNSHVEVIISSLAPVYGNPAELYQIFSNILENAIKYSAQQSAPQVIISSKSVKNKVSYLIQDNGCGIPETELSKIFKISTRGSNTTDVTGQGIGLYIVRRLLLRLGGEIAISSRLGVGNQVRLTFPSRNK